MKLIDIIKTAKTDLTIIGVLPIVEELERSGEKLTDMLISEELLHMKILCESDTLCFGYSLLTDTKGAKNKKSSTYFVTHRDRIIGKNQKSGLRFDIRMRDESSSERVSIFQQNAQMPFSAIIVDEKVYYTLITNIFPTLDDYLLIQEGDMFYNQIIEYTNFFFKGDGKKFLSVPGDELIQMYDSNNYPRGIYPRSCFYTTKYKRRSMWGFVFNRNGELLMHQRSMTTKDGRGLWDKSTGGHVDIKEESIVTAKRELVEELFMPEAEFTKYMTAFIEDIIGFGEWNLDKRPELSYKDAFHTLDKNDWILFSAPNDEGIMGPIDRPSKRKIYIDDQTTIFKPTIFISDIYFFIAPVGYIDDEKQMNTTFKVSEEKGAAQSHKLISLNDLKDWIDYEVSNGNETNVFTDDMVYINQRYMGVLESFSEFVRFTFGK